MVNRSARRQDPVEVCRTCMTSSPEKRNRKRIPIFARLEDAFIANIITDCTGVQIDENDGLPAAICTGCFKTVELLVTFIKSTRDSDTKLRQLCKVEQLDEEDDVGGPANTEADATHFLEIKCEPPEDSMVDETVQEAAVESDEAEPDNDTDTDWKGSDEEEEELKRKVKRQRLGLKSKPKPRKKIGRPKGIRIRPSNVPVQSEDDLKLSEKEQELFTTIEIEPNSHVCCGCGCCQVFKSAEELETHRKLAHVWKNEKKMKPMPDKHLCNGCLRRYTSPTKLNYHLERIRLLKAVWECKKCLIRFKIAAKRREHVKLHPDDAPVAIIARVRDTTVQEFGWTCCGRNCGASFSTELELIAHGVASHRIEKQKADQEAAEKPVQCQICFLRYATMKKLVCHQRRPYKRSNIQCSLCGLKFYSTAQLTAHEGRDHDNKPFPCAVCDKKFTSEMFLAKHVAIVHTDYKPHQCTVCGMTFKQKGNLKTHMSNHIEVPQFKCEVCSKMFKGDKQLRYHMRIHTGEKPYKCKICGHAFANHTNCRRHEMTHTGDKPHKCSYCEKSFILKRMLIEHESTHTGVKIPRKVSNQPQQSAIVEHMDVVQVDDDDDEDVGSSNDSSYHQTLAFANRPVSISVARPTVAHPVNSVHQASHPQLVAALSNETIQSAAVAVYNVIPSTSGSSYEYILKF